VSNTKKKPHPVAGLLAYLRVSTDEQADSGLGIEAQRAAITAESARRGIPIIAWHDDLGLSGKNMNRPGLKAALASLAAGQGSMLVVSKLDRLSRSVHDATGLMRIATKQGWDLVALDVQIDTSTPAGAAMTQMMLVFAELERRLIGQRTKDALAVKRSQGVQLGRPRTIADAVVARIVMEHEAGVSWSAIARGLNEDRIPTAQGGTWHPATVRLIGTRDRTASGG
jgi:DNA invertase Pin-like site-specific DNA recombinase